MNRLATATPVPGAGALLAVFWAILLFASGSTRAQTLFINDGSIHTMGPTTVLPRADLLIRDGRIQDLGSDLEAPADALVIEAGGKPVTPGFFAGITELGLAEIELEASTVDSRLQTDAMRPEFDVTTAFNPNASAIPVTRIEGYTWTVLGAYRAGSIIGGQGRAVSLDGAFDAFLGIPLLFIDVGADAAEQSGGSRAAQWMQLNQAMDEARSEVRWSPGALLTPAGRKTLAGYENGGTVVFNVDRASDIRKVLAFASRQQFNAVISGGTEAWMVATDLAEAGVAVLLDPLVNLPSSFDHLGARLDNAAILNEAGVTISFLSTKDYTTSARKLRQAAGNAVANGLPWEAALAGLTSNPAQIFSLADGAGVLEPGNRADVVVWSGDPLEVTSVAEQVIIGGQAIPMVSRQTLLRDRYMPENPDWPRAYLKP